jgi:anti-sigma-K factor RskA
MHSGKRRDRFVEGLLFQYFENEMDRVAVPEPDPELTASWHRRSAHPFALDLLVRAAAAVVIAGLLAILPAASRQTTPLREAVASIWSEKAYQRCLPSAERMRDIIKSSFERRKIL